ncbi:MFS transporter [Legionella sp. CNM-1927-20]|uniref:MFS transporter n=1 Tax=Legionella sp. CNM-1927-20 TaxID=3422221 RepID=UPI00403A833C
MPINKSSKSNPIVIIGSLFLAIIIDQMGITFVFPILTPLFMEPTSNLISTGMDKGTRDVLFGLCLALYPLFMFFGAPLLGALSDQLGRKATLLLCLLGSAASFVLSAIAINLGSLILLLFSRASAGFFSGSQYIAQAAIADISPEDKKAVNLSYIIVAISIGMIFGPLVGGYLSDPNFFKGLTYATPFEAAALLAFINALILWLIFPETFIRTNPVKLNLFEGFTLLKEAFTNLKIRLLSFLLFFFMFGWTLYFQSISWFLFQQFKFTPNKIGLFIAYLGIAFALALMIVLKLLLKYLKKPSYIILLCLSMNTIALLLALSIPFEAIQWISGPFIIGSMAITYTLVLTLFSDAVGEDKQGWIMGVSGAFVAIAWTLAGLLAGPFGYFNIHLPFLISTLLVIVALILTFRLQIHSAK